jgi:hypothetical protein
MSFTTPVEIDTELARLIFPRDRALARAGQYRKLAQDQADRGADLSSARSIRQADEYSEEARKLTLQIIPLRKLYTGWNRYFLVTNTGGHVHRNQECTTCYPTTQYHWITSLSDCDESELVAQYGELACTVCFPNAPVYKGFNDGTSAIARYTAAEKAERARIKAEKAAVKAAKTLDPPIRVSRHGGESLHLSDRIETVAAAKSWIKGTIDDQIIYGYNLDARSVADGVFALQTALAVKGIDIEPLIAKWTKAAQKARKGGSVP